MFSNNKYFKIIFSFLSKFFSGIFFVILFFLKFIKKTLFLFLVTPILQIAILFKKILANLVSVIKLVFSKIIKYKLALVFYIVYYNYNTCFYNNDITCIYLRDEIIVFFENKNLDSVVWLFWFLNALIIKLIYYLAVIRPRNKKFYSQLSPRERRILQEKNRSVMSKMFADIVSKEMYAQFMVYKDEKNENETYVGILFTWLKVTFLLWPYWLLYVLLKRFGQYLVLMRTTIFKTLFNWKPLFKKSSYNGLSKTFFLNKLSKTYQFLKKPFVNKKKRFIF